jgi:cytoskeletal protein CcmA (bactofilin family)
MAQAADTSGGGSAFIYDGFTNEHSVPSLTVGLLNGVDIESTVGSISAAQWGYLGAMDQHLSTTSDVTFATLHVTGAVTFDSTLDVTGTSTLGVVNADALTCTTFAPSGLSTLAALIATGTSNLQGAVDCDTTLNVDGASTLAAVTMDGKLHVDGAQTCLDYDGTQLLLRRDSDTTKSCSFAVDINGDLAIVPIGGDANITGALGVSSTFNVGGATTMDTLSCTTLNATGDVTLSNPVRTSSSIHFSNSGATTGLYMRNAADTADRAWILSNGSDGNMYVYSEDASSGIHFYRASDNDFMGSIVNGDLTMAGNLNGVDITSSGTATSNTLGVNTSTLNNYEMVVNGQAHFGDAYDPTIYGQVQITRAPNQGTTGHLAFIRSGNRICQFGYQDGSNMFGITDGASTATSTGIFFDGVNSRVGIMDSSPSYTLDVAGAISNGKSVWQDNTIELGSLNSGNQNSYLDMRSDDTYTDFGLRLIRYNGGPNTDSDLRVRGTGALRIICQDAGSVVLGTSDLARVTVNSSGNVSMTGDLTVSGTISGSWGSQTLEADDVQLTLQRS